jgi:hypothetical protein
MNEQDLIFDGLRSATANPEGDSSCFLGISLAHKHHA